MAELSNNAPFHDRGHCASKDRSRPAQPHPETRQARRGVAIAEPQVPPIVATSPEKARTLRPSPKGQAARQVERQTESHVPPDAGQVHPSQGRWLAAPSPDRAAQALYHLVCFGGRPVCGPLAFDGAVRLACEMLELRADADVSVYDMLEGVHYF